MTLPPDVLEILCAPSICFLTTLMKDGSPQTTETWVDTNGDHVVIHSVEGYQKVLNVSRDPRVAVVLCDPKRPSRYAEIRGDVIRMTTEGGAEHIDQLSMKYMGHPYESCGALPQTPVILTINAEKSRMIGA